MAIMPPPTHTHTHTRMYVISSLQLIKIKYKMLHYKVYTYIVKHDYILGGMLFTICKAQLHVSATNVGHLQIVQ
jgi:hypothetical protein